MSKKKRMPHRTGKSALPNKGRPVVCPYCGKDAALVGGNVLYPHRPDLYYLLFWSCQPCEASVGTHKGSFAVPFGSLAKPALKRARNRGHNLFDQIWKAGDMARNEAYAFLAAKMKIPAKECHFSWFSEEQIEQAIDICNEYLDEQ